MHRGGFTLRKWNSNNDELLKNITDHQNDIHSQHITIASDSTSKTLGLLWNSKDDSMQFSHDIDQTTHEDTKRTILSQVAKLFDPLGLASSLIIRAKILLQDLWKNTLDWDDKMPQDLQDRWLSFKNCLKSLDKLQVPRCTVTNQPGGKIEMHGFSDASEQAYGGVIYVKYISKDGNSQVKLLCSKSRVAPLKTISLPRLELCGALLLAKLMAHIHREIGSKISKMYFLSDFSIVLAWISSEAARWKTFVANRVSKIYEVSNPTDWTHVRSEDNPADLVSRGTRTEDLLHSSLWWNGPMWLKEDDSKWPSALSTCNQESVVSEEKRKGKVSAASIVNDNSYMTNTVQRFSSLQRLQRVVAHCKRFSHNCKYRESKQNWQTLLSVCLSETERICKNIDLVERLDT